MADLGRLEMVDLREAWANEATSFTPWLAKPENLALLGDAIGLELAAEAVEQHVGPFRADILCKVATTDRLVLIENQIEQTDHCHLGQLLTYAAGLHAATIIWVAAKIRDEHRAAIDWLNEITGEQFHFFALEIELWKIGESATAPKFNVVCEPNEWSKTVQEEAKGIAATGLGEAGKLYLEYWTALREYMEAHKSPVVSQKPQPDHWASHAIGRANFNLVAVVRQKSNTASARVSISGRQAKSHYKSLYAQKDAIERELGEPLDWQELPNKKESRVDIRLDEVDPKNRSDWPRQHAWFREKLEKLHRVLCPRIKALPYTYDDAKSGTSA